MSDMLDLGALQTLLERSAGAKARVVAADEREGGGNVTGLADSHQGAGREQLPERGRVGREPGDDRIKLGHRATFGFNLAHIMWVHIGDSGFWERDK